MENSTKVKYARVEKWLIDSEEGALVGDDQYYEPIPLPYRYFDLDTEEVVYDILSFRDNAKENDTTVFQVYYEDEWKDADSSEWRVLDDCTDEEIQDYIEVTTMQVLRNQNRAQIKQAGSELLQLMRKIGQSIEDKDFQTVTALWESHGKVLSDKLPAIEEWDVIDFKIS